MGRNGGTQRGAELARGLYFQGVAVGTERASEGGG